MVRKKRLIVTLVICVLAFVSATVLLITDKVKYNDYLEVDAVITKVYTEYGKATSNSLSRSNYVSYEFTVDGETYEATVQVFAKFGYEVGNTQKIRVNQEDKTQIENVLLSKVYVFVDVFSGVLIVFVVLLRRTHYF